MPTGYTYKIDNGTLTNSKDFIKLCLNAFGVMVHNKGNAPTTERPDFNKVYASDIEYYTKQITQAREKLSKAEEDFKINYDRYKNRVLEELKEKISIKKKYIQEQKEIETVYNRIKEGVENWDCSEKYNEIKAFCIEQLDMGKPEYSFNKKYLEELEKNIENFDEYFKEYHASIIEGYMHDIEYNTKSLDKTKKKIQEKQEFYDGIIKELDSITE